jgi:molecular chaperone HscA
VHAKIDVKPSYGLSDAQISGMLKESFATAQQDMQARALAEARLEADRMILATQSALQADADLLDDDERARIDALIQSTGQSKLLVDAARISAATQALDKGTEAFAALRMNRGIQQALAGRNIETV